MDLHLKNKIVVITGGSKGIGLATARLFTQEGASIIILDKENEKTYAIGDTTFYTCDVREEDQVKSTFLNIKEEFDHIDILVNNAGIQRYGTVTDTPSSVWDETMQVNVKGYFLIAKYGIPIMAHGSSVIVNVASAMSLMGGESTAAYSSGKSAILGLTRSIAIDYADRLRCVAVCPGAVDTPMLHDDIDDSPERDSLLKQLENIHILKRIATADEIANFIVFLSSDRASFATGQYYRVDGGIGIKI